MALRQSIIRYVTKKLCHINHGKVPDAQARYNKKPATMRSAGNFILAMMLFLRYCLNNTRLNPVTESADTNK